MNKEKIFAAKVNELIKQANNLQDDAVSRVITLLEDARKEVIDRINYASTDWQAYQLPKLKAAIEKEMRNFRFMAHNEIVSVNNEAWGLGVSMCDKPLHAIGFNRLIPSIDPTMLGILQDYSADLITGLSQDATRKINAELTKALLGQQTPFDAMNAIGTNLDSPSVFRSIAKRAEVITRTEGGRIIEAGHQARRESAAKVLPGLKKKWRHGAYVKNPRSGHLAAVDQTVDWDKPFLVASEIGDVEEELHFPRDPRGSAGNTINCDCSSEDYHENWDDVVNNQGVMEIPAMVAA